MRKSAYKGLPLFLNAEMAAKMLDVSPSSEYELMRKTDFLVGNQI